MRHNPAGFFPGRDGAASGIAGPMQAVAIIQARMGSTRLPGKVLELVEGRTVLGHTIGRARAIRGLDEVVVATTRLERDDAVVTESERHGARSWRGSEDDVLSRYLGAARESGADVIMRITSDCPLLDPELSSGVLSALLSALAAGDPVDYASNSLVRRNPRGVDTEAFTRAALERAAEQATAAREREHVTLYMYEHPDAFRLLSIPGEHDHAHHRWTVDTPEDLQLVREVYARLAPDHGLLFGMQPVLDLLVREPWIARINQHVEQKKA